MWPDDRDRPPPILPALEQVGASRSPLRSKASPCCIRWPPLRFAGTDSCDAPEFYGGPQNHQSSPRATPLPAGPPCAFPRPPVSPAKLPIACPPSRETFDNSPISSVAGSRQVSADKALFCRAGANMLVIRRLRSQSFRWKRTYRVSVLSEYPVSCPYRAGRNSAAH